MIRGERLKAPGATTAALLAEVPGVQVARTGGPSDLATASIRGATSAETPVYLAGVRLNDDITGTADLSLVPLWMINRIEVYRSGAPLEADRLGIGGAIFLEPTLPRGTRAGAGAIAGSFGEAGGWAAIAIGDARAGAMLAVRRQGAENNYTFVDDGGTRFDTRDDRQRRRRNADYITSDAWGLGRWRVGRAAVTIVANGLTRDQGITGLSILPATAASAHAQRWLGAITAAMPCAHGKEDDARERCRLELVSSAVAATSLIRDPMREIALGVPWIASRGGRIAEEARLRYRISDGLMLGLGLVQEIERLAIDAPGLALLRAQRSTSRASVMSSIALPRSVDLNALVSIERSGTSGPGTQASASVNPSARIGAKLRLTDTFEILVNAGRYVRVPTLGETYGTSAVVRGNSLLAPEKGLSADAGVRFSAFQPDLTLTAETFGFARFASDLIAFRRSSLGVVRPYNVADARVLGLELDLDVRIFRRIRLGMALTLLDPRDVSPDRTLVADLLPFQARLTVVPVLELNQGPIPALRLQRASLAARLLYRGSRVADPAGLVLLATQAQLDVTAALGFFGDRLATRLEIVDVLGTTTFDVVGLPLPGRSIHGSMEVWWW